MCLHQNLKGAGLTLRGGRRIQTHTLRAFMRTMYAVAAHVINHFQFSSGVVVHHGRVEPHRGVAGARGAFGGCGNKPRCGLYSPIHVDMDMGVRVVKRPLYTAHVGAGAFLWKTGKRHGKWRFHNVSTG